MCTASISAILQQQMWWIKMMKLMDLTIYHKEVEESARADLTKVWLQSSMDQLICKHLFLILNHKDFCCWGIDKRELQLHGSSTCTFVGSAETAFIIFTGTWCSGQQFRKSSYSTWKIQLTNFKRQLFQFIVHYIISLFNYFVVVLLQWIVNLVSVGRVIVMPLSEKNYLMLVLNYYIKPSMSNVSKCM